MLNDAAVKLPEWTSRSTNDFGVVLIEEMAGLGDILSYYTDRIASEAYLPTATQRASILNIAAMLDYRPDTGRPAATTLTIGVVPGSGRIFIPAGSQFSSASSQPDVVSVVVFETDNDLYIDQSPSVVAYGNVSATQGVTVSSEDVGMSDGTEGQTMQLATASVIEGSVLVYVDEGVGPQPWAFVEHLIDAGPLDKVFTTFTDAFSKTSIVFGDNVNGRAPSNGGVVTSTYRVGGGTVGNVGAGSVTTVANAPSGVSSVSNQEAASGGTDPETNEQIRTNAPKALSTLHRGVSLEDYANLCLNVTGVAKASAAGIIYTGITVYIAPVGGGIATAVTKQRVLTYLADKKMVNAHVTIEDPVYVPINISVSIQVADSYTQSAVSNAVGNALANLLNFDNVNFGQRVTVSDVYRAVVSVEGVVYASVDLLARSGSGAADVVLASNEIPTASGATQNINVTGGGISAASGGASGTGAESVIPTAPGAPVIDSITCGVTPNNHQFAMTLHWAGSTGATVYAVILDFYNGSTYVGSMTAGMTNATNATVTGTFIGADTVHVHIQAINGVNRTDGPVTTNAYPCG